MKKKEILYTGMILAMSGLLSSCDHFFSKQVNVYGPPPVYDESAVFESSYWNDEEEATTEEETVSDRESKETRN